MTVNIDMREQFINDTCILFQRLGEGVDLQKVRSILVMATNNYQMQKTTTEVAVYTGNENEKVLKAFLVAKKVNGCTFRTINYYKLTIEQFFRKTGKHISEINANDIRVYFAERELSDKVSAQTRDNERRNLSSFFTWLLDEEYITKNPMKKISKIKGQKQKKKAFSEMEIEKIRQAARQSKKPEKYTAFVEIMLSTGCRVGEISRIKAEEVKVDLVVVHGKGQKDRNCYLNAKAKLAIKNWMETDEFKKHAEMGNPYLFARQRTDGQHRYAPTDIGTIESTIRNLGKVAGVENTHPHRFRRTFATKALKRGMPIEQVSKALGHESLETTQIYLDLDENSLKEAHQKYVE